MSKLFTKCFVFYRLILVAVCLCLSINSVAGVLIVAHHDMAPADTADHAAQQQNILHSEHHVEQHEPNQHADAHDCCDDGEESCATSLACATHCSASFAQKSLNLCPVIALSGFEADTVFTGILSLNLDGPFKPPR